MKIGIIIGSVRDGRAGESIADWVIKKAAGRDDAEFVTLDLKSFNLPILTSALPAGMANKQYDDPAVAAWSQAVDACDAFVFITPEYNHSIPGAFKNAFDSIGPEWANKPVAFVSYGFDNGLRAVEHWRTIVANFSMFDLRTQVGLSLLTDRDEAGFAANERREGELDALFNDLVGITAKLSN